MYIYVVEAGDTITGIANEFGVNPEELIAYNQLPNPFQLVPGQTIVIQTGETESLGRINVNGYVYPYVDRNVLRSTLPYINYISIFAYGFNENGDLSEIEDDEIIAIADEYEVHPVLVLAPLADGITFNSNIASAMFQNIEVQNRLISNIINKIQEKGYVGLDIDFEYIPAEDKEGYIAFIENAATQLNAQGYFVNVDLAPKTSANQTGLLYESHDYRRIGEVANRVLIMTYEWGYTYGPPMAVAPLNSVANVLNYAVTEIPPGKIFMGIPNYGYDWILPYKKGNPGATSIGNVQAVEIAAQYGAEILYDELAQSPYFYYTDEEGRARVIWFEDARSVEAKFRLAASLQLNGLGYWNLMRPFPQNWLVLANLFEI